MISHLTLSNHIDIKEKNGWGDIYIYILNNFQIFPNIPDDISIYIDFQIYI